jgi:hypothetical protein
MSEKDKGFTVKDRRLFSEEGEPAEKGEPSTPKGPERVVESESSAQDEKPKAPLPQINFSTFIASLNASALVHLGVIEDPVSDKAEKNLAMAKQTIDILSMLQQKTTGNLAPDEDSMLKSILYDLRILFVKEKG